MGDVSLSQAGDGMSRIKHVMSEGNEWECNGMKWNEHEWE